MDEIFEVREARVSYHGRRSRLRAFSSSRDVHEFLLSKIQDNGCESMLAIFTDARNRPMSWSTIATGGPDSCPVDMRNLFRTAILANANGIVLAHNHPSGDVRPSREDLELTRRIKAGAEVFQFRLLDHLIVSHDPDDKQYYSMLDEGDLR